MTPCSTCPKVPDDASAKTREHAVELSDRNRQAYEHYRECRAVGEWPRDWLVRRNARLIREIEDMAERTAAVRSLASLFNKGG